MLSPSRLAWAVAAVLACSMAAAEPLLDGRFELYPVPDGRSVFAVQGWAVGCCDQETDAVEVALLVDGVEQLRGRPFFAWPGVEDRFPGLPGADRAGFSAQVDPVRYTPGEHRLEVVVEACGLTKSLGVRSFRTLPPTTPWVAVPLLLVALAGIGFVGLPLAGLSPGRGRVRGLVVAVAAGAGLVAVVVISAPHLASEVRQVRPGLFAPLANWDGGFYLRLAADGYGAEVNPVFAFFPLFPAVLSVLAKLPGPVELAASLFNIGCFLLAVLLLRRIYPDRDRGLIFFAALPFTFFYVAVYTEALALVLAVAFVWAVRTRRLPWVVTCGFLAALCRIPGVALSCFAVTAFVRGDRRLAAAAGLAPLGGLASWMAWLGWSTGDPLAFVHAMDEFGRSTTFHPGVFLDHLCSLPGRGGMTWWELGAAVTVLAGAAALVRLRRFDEAFYSAAVVLIPLASMRLTSLNRYALAAFPVIVLLGSRLAGSLPRWVFSTVVAAELIGLFYFAARFGLQYWVG